MKIFILPIWPKSDPLSLLTLRRRPKNFTQYADERQNPREKRGVDRDPRNEIQPLAPYRLGQSRWPDPQKLDS